MVINIILEQGFERWLKTLGYAESTVYLSTHSLRDFFFYLKKNEIKTLEEITTPTIHNYHKYLENRANKRLSGGLTQNTIACNISVLKRFSKYLQETGKPYFEVGIKTKIETDNTKTILTPKEIQKLYKSCSDDPLGKRDKAMLGIYYGCGLRRNEGVNLNIEDILLKENLVHVKRAKHYKERYVPLTESIKEDLENYINESREKLQNPKEREALFLSYRGRRMHGYSLLLRLQKLTESAQINKTIGLHTLRHSIATHLLQSGMELEEISRFLGHGGLEPTQIYTHLAHELQEI